MSNYEELLALMNKHTILFTELTETQMQKTEAARNYDIPALEECMKKEQASTLALKGYDKKREALLEKLSFSGMTFRELIPLLPDEYQSSFSQEFQRLNDAYRVYQGSADCSKQQLEVNIHRLNLAMEELRQKTKTQTGETYSPNGFKDTEKLTFKDMKI